MVRLRLKPTKKVLIILGVLAFLSLGTSYLVYGNRAKTRQEWDAKLAAKVKEAKEVEEAAKQLPASEKRLEELQYRVSFLRGAGDEEYQPALLVEATELARRTGVKISSFNPVEAAPAAKSPAAKSPTAKKLAPHRFLTVNMTLQGSFHNITRFLYRLAGLSKIMSVDTLQVGPAPEGGSTDVRVTAQATAYVLKDVPPSTMAAALLLQEILDAELKYKKQARGYGTLEQLRAADLTKIKEGETIGGYTFTTDKGAGSKFRILAKPKDAKLHTLSVDDNKKVMDETDKVPYE